MSNTLIKVCHVNFRICRRWVAFDYLCIVFMDKENKTWKYIFNLHERFSWWRARFVTTEMSSRHILRLLILMIIISASVSRRRRRRRSCSIVDCQVTPWSSWSACSAVPCGQSGTRERSRTVQLPALCGGKACPSLLEVVPCQGTLRVDFQLSSWSGWSKCSLVCGGFQTSTRYVVTNEQCGGTSCNSTLSKRQACNITQCLNQGTLTDGQCSCPPSYYGSCCQYNSK